MCIPFFQRFYVTPGDDLVDWNSGVSVCPSVRPSIRPQKVFSDFHVIWCVGRSRQICGPMWPRPDLRSWARSRSFRSCENCTFLGLPPPPFWRGAQIWCLIVIVRDMATACRSPIFEFPSMKAITRVQTSPNVDISRNSNGHILVVHDATVRWLGILVLLHVLCVLIWPWPDPRSRSTSRSIWTSTFLGLSPPTPSRGAQNWWLLLMVWDLVYSLSEPDFRSSRDVDSSRNSIGHISVVRDATLRWLGTLVVLQVLCMLIWPWPDPTSRSRSRGFWTANN